MDPGSSPWRVLEGAGEASAPPAGARPVSTGRDRMIPIAAVAVAIVLAVAAFAVAASGGHPTVEVTGAGAGSEDPFRPQSSGAARAGSSASDRLLVVDVQGAVVHPGVVRLVEGSRVGDAIAAAGGYGPRVAPEVVARVLNLAALVKDGDKVVVPSRDDPAGPAGPPGPAGGSTAGTSGGDATVVDLNTATEAQLDALPGIGPVTAAKIIAAREEQPFRSVDDLKTRKILGAATFEKLKTLVVVR
jgi:competence protein ComEA